MKISLKISEIFELFNKVSFMCTKNKKCFPRITMYFGNKCEFPTRKSLMRYSSILKEFLKYENLVKSYQKYLNYLTKFFETKFVFIFKKN